MWSSRAGVTPGLTRNWAPAATAASAWPGVRMVPAPTRMSGTSLAMSFSEVRALSVRSVSSMIRMPPSASARATGNRVLRVVDGHHRDDRGNVQNAGGVSHG